MKELVFVRQEARPKLRRRRRTAFTAERRQKFLDALAYSCNATAAAEHAGVAVTTPYRHRGEDPEFAAAWRAALDAGYDRLEALVLEHCGAGQALEPADPERAAAAGTLPAFDFERAMRVLEGYRKVRGGADRARPGRQPGPNATREETNAALLKAIEAAEKRLARERGDG
jgi:hypothetical protein